MVNRILIRIKVVQIAYAYFNNSTKNFDAAEKELLFSLDKSYEMYNSLLLLLVSMTDMQRTRLENAKLKFLATKQELNPNSRFIDNRFIAQLQENNMLLAYANEQKISWVNNSDFVRIMLDKVLASELYEEYMDNKESSYELDREFWKNAFRQIILEDEDLAEHLEQESLYWNDDLFTIATFVLKTIKRFEEKLGAEQPLLPMFKDEEDRTYASKLFRETLLKEEENRALVTKYIKNWEMDRIAFMDVVIMLVALAEIQTFPSIPVRVSLNEYIEIAKTYSTAKSGNFINGVLDAITADYKKEGTLTKA